MAQRMISPAWGRSRGSLVRAEGAAGGVPLAGCRVYGCTRQNLWSQSSKTQNGVTCTSNDDGSTTVSGTSTSSNLIYFATSCALKPGGTYVLSTDKPLSTTEDAGGFFVQYTDADNVNTTIAYANGTAAREIVFTVPEGSKACVFGVQVRKDKTVSGTYRVMLNEGSTAEPWCPPGLTSVGELSVAASGKNLVSIPDKTVANGFAFNNVKIPRGLDGRAVTLSFEIGGAETPNSSVNFIDAYTNVLTEEFINSQGPKCSATLTVPDGTASIGLWCSNSTPTTFANVQLELGPTATAYEPPAVTTTPIDLDGLELRSLPDGTCDVLAVDGSGAVDVEQNTSLLVLDGTQELAYISPENRYCVTVDNAEPLTASDIADPAIMCDLLPVVSNNETFSGRLGVHRRTDGSSSIVLCVPASWGASADEVQSYLSSHPMTVIYPLASTNTTDLTPVDPPTVPAPDASLWAASDVPCELEATWWTATGRAEGEQQAALIEVARQVRQQAEAVAALSAQALEA